MCIDAPESTPNSLSSGFVADGAGRHQTSVGEKKVALSYYVSFRILLVVLHASPRAHRSCLSPSLHETDPQVLERTGCADHDF